MRGSSKEDIRDPDDETKTVHVSGGEHRTGGKPGDEYSSDPPLPNTRAYTSDDDGLSQNDWESDGERNNQRDEGEDDDYSSDMEELKKEDQKYANEHKQEDQTNMRDTASEFQTINPGASSNDEEPGFPAKGSSSQGGAPAPNAASNDSDRPPRRPTGASGAEAHAGAVEGEGEEASESTDAGSPDIPDGGQDGDERQSGDGGTELDDEPVQASLSRIADNLAMLNANFTILLQHVRHAMDSS